MQLRPRSSGRSGGPDAQRVAALVALGPLLGLLLGPLLGIGLGPAAGQQQAPSQPWSGRLPGAEGPLDNASFIATSEAAAARLARGDAALAELARTPNPSPAFAARVHHAAFDDWQAALDESGAGDVVPAELAGEAGGKAGGVRGERGWPDPDGTAARRFEGVERAVLRRLAALGPAERAAWRERFAPLADERRRAALAQSGATLLAASATAVEAREAQTAATGVASLDRVERGFPGTAAAAQAALALADLHLERGEPRFARAWLARAAAHAELGAFEGAPDARAAFAAALERRAAALGAIGAIGAIGALDQRDTGGALDASGDPSSRRSEPQAWRTASAFELEARYELALELPSRGSDEGRIRPGLVELDDGRLALQGSASVHFVEPSTGRTTRVELDPALASVGVEVGRTFESRAAPGWRLEPQRVGNDIALVHGRVRPGDSNALVRLTPPPGRDALGLPVARLEWVVHNGIRRSAAGVEHAIPALQELPGHEFQPGVAVVDSLVVVALRVWQLDRLPLRQSTPTSGQSALSSASEVHTLAAAFDARTGDLAWLRPLATGFELSDSSLRGAVQARDTASAAPQVVGAHAFLGSNLGSASLLSVPDGRMLWTCLTRRRSLDAAGWDGGAALAVDGEFLFGPADSDRLYAFHAAPRVDGAVFARRPRPVGDARVLVDANAERAVALGTVGDRPALAFHELASGAQYEALYLDVTERFTGRALASPERVWASTDRALYLFDRTRDGLLLASFAYAQGPAGRRIGGGDVFATRAGVVVLGPSGERKDPAALWIFRPAGADARGR